jgi:hypothetical protein
MRSGSPEEAKRELDWAMLSYLVLGLMSVEGRAAEDRDPLNWSPSESLRIVRRALRSNERFRQRGDLRVLLSQTEKDSYWRQRPKAARDWPNKKNDPPPGAPKIREATAKEKAAPKRIYENSEAA